MISMDPKSFAVVELKDRLRQWKNGELFSRLELHSACGQIPGLLPAW